MQTTKQSLTETSLLYAEGGFRSRLWFEESFVVSHFDSEQSSYLLDGLNTGTPTHLSFYGFKGLNISFFYRQFMCDD